MHYRCLWVTPTFKPKQDSLLPQYNHAFKIIDNDIIGNQIIFGYAYLLYGYAHFWSVNYITLNSELSCSLYAYIYSLRYQPLKLRSTFDYCTVEIWPWPNQSKVASVTSDTDCIYAVVQHVIVVTWAWGICLICMPKARRPLAYILGKSRERMLQIICITSMHYSCVLQCVLYCIRRAICIV